MSSEKDSHLASTIYFHISKYFGTLPQDANITQCLALQEALSN